MAHRAPHDHWRGLRPALPGPRTRVIVAMIGCLLSVGAPVAVFGISGLTAEEQPGRPPDDPASLGITGALPGDPLPDGLLEAGAPGDGTPGDAVASAPPELPLPPDLAAGPLGIPGVVLAAYQRAEQTMAGAQPGCHLSWSLLAGIGRIESGHASGGRVDAACTTLGPILGRALDGSPGVASIPDTDRGALDADAIWDHAVGPMQFIPTSWHRYGTDGNEDGVASPHNIYDSTIAAARYLCAGGGDLSDPAQLQAAVFRYNHSAAYVTIVLRWAQAYQTGVIPTPPAQGPVAPGPTGNGGAPIVTNNSPRVLAGPATVAPLPAPPPAVTTTAPLAAPPQTTPPPATTPPETTAPPVTTTPETTTPPVSTTPETTAPPVTTPAETTTPPPPPTTTPPATTTSSPPPPPTTTTPAAPAPVPSPPPPP